MRWPYRHRVFLDSLRRVGCGRVEATCHKCGKTLSAEYGILLPLTPRPVEPNTNMPCCTYLNADECTAPVSDPELNSLLAELRKVTGRDWRLEERVRSMGRLWWRRCVKSYLLYAGMPDGVEFQVINFYTADGSLTPFVPAQVIAAYIYGYMGGMEARR